MVTPLDEPTGDSPFSPPPPSLFKKIWIPLLAIVVLAVAGLFLVKSQFEETGTTSPSASNGATGEVAVLNVGASLPDFSLRKFKAGGPTEVVKASDLKAKVVLLNFWATWCEACMVEMPTLVQLYNQYKDKGFLVAAVNLDENPETVVPAASQELKMGFPIFLDIDQRLADLFDIHGIPLTVIMDDKRKILMVETGERDWNSADFRSQLEQWLGG